MMKVLKRRPIAASVAFVAVMAAAGASLAQPESGQNPVPPAASSPAPHHESVVVSPKGKKKIFDMQQCTEDGFCRMATCVSNPGPDGTVIVCQIHGNFFP